MTKGNKFKDGSGAKPKKDKEVDGDLEAVRGYFIRFMI